MSKYWQIKLTRRRDMTHHNMVLSPDLISCHITSHHITSLHVLSYHYMYFHQRIVLYCIVLCVPKRHATLCCEQVNAAATATATAIATATATATLYNVSSNVRCIMASVVAIAQTEYS